MCGHFLFRFALFAVAKGLLLFDIGLFIILLCLSSVSTPSSPGTPKITTTAGITTPVTSPKLAPQTTTAKEGLSKGNAVYVVYLQNVALSLLVLVLL